MIKPVLVVLAVISLVGGVSAGITMLDHFESPGVVSDSDIIFLSYTATFENGILVFHIGDCDISTNYRFKGTDFTTTTKPTRAGNKLSYEAPQAKIEIEFSESLIKEVVTVNNKIRLPLSHRITLSPGFTMTSNPDGSLSISRGDGIQYATVQKPYAIDAGGRRYELTYSWDGSVLTLNGDLSKATFPVQIDPSYAIDTVSNIGQYTSIALDSSNYPHISYYDFSSSNLKYTKWNGTAWVIEVVKSSGDVGKYASLALDSSNYPHISYYDDTDDNLEYAKWNGTAWNIEVVDSTDSTGQYTSIALDSSNYPHISYYDVTGKDLEYAKWNGTGWVKETPDSLNDVGQFTSIALDSSNYPHISYYYVTSANLRYVNWTGSTWAVQTIETTDVVGRYTSITLDSSNYPHISYNQFTNKDLKYVVWNGTAWNGEVVDTDGVVDMQTSLALDSSNYPHISYYYIVGANDLRYAKWNGAGWVKTTLDSGGDVGRDSDITLDSSNYIYISYLDNTNYDLKYYTDLPAPTAAFSANDTTITEGDTVAFTDSSTPTSGLYWQWDLDGDGDVDSTSQNPTYQYTTVGTYTVNLTVTNVVDDDVESKVDYITVESGYIPTPPVTDFTADDTTICAGSTVTFTDSSTNTPTSWNWSFDDGGGNSTDQDPERTFTNPGLYTITLTATNADGSDTEEKVDYISVGAVPVAAFTANETNGIFPLTVLFTDTSTGSPSSWAWDVDGDGTTDYTTQNVTHTYTEQRKYTVRLTVNNAAGCGPDSETKTDYISVWRSLTPRNPPPGLKTGEGFIAPIWYVMLMFANVGMITYSLYDNANRNYFHIVAAIGAVILSFVLALFIMNGFIADGHVLTTNKTVIDNSTLRTYETNYTPYVDVGYGWFFVFIGVVMLVIAVLASVEAVRNIRTPEKEEGDDDEWEE